MFSRFARKFPLALIGGASAAGALYSSGEDHVEPPYYPWSHKSSLQTYDASAIRRGHLVYTQVCASCHSMSRVHYRNLVGVCYSEDEAKALAKAITVVDGPNDAGEMFEREGKLQDPFPSPYRNEQHARSINNGALPPDLSLIAKSRGRGEDYIFALLTGYCPPPAGVTVNEAAGQYYNPYFPGGKIGMGKQLMDGAVEYPDGTPATESQMAKDVAVFLMWAAEPDQDIRREYGLKWFMAVVAAAAVSGFYKRWRWNPVKTRRITYPGEL